MSESIRTTITLELSTDERTYPNVSEALEVFREVPGVESLSPKYTASTCSITLEIRIAAPDQKKLQRLYLKLSKMGNKPPFLLHGRGCVMDEMFPGITSRNASR